MFARAFKMISFTFYVAYNLGSKSFDKLCDHQIKLYIIENNRKTICV